MSKDREKLLYMLFGLIQNLPNNYIDMFNIDTYLTDADLAMDKEIMDCQFSLYMLMLMDANDKEFDNRLESFCKQFKKLSLEKQEYIKNDYYKILKEQEKNKEKGEMKL